MATAEKKTSKIPKSAKQQQQPEEINGKCNNRVVVKEGHNLLGSPTFEKLENGRFKCIETGHETLLKDKDSYVNSKRCRLGLIDFALSQKKTPLNMFKQDPHCRLKLVCKLTGDIVNKTEEHIWKHINGKRFLNKLEQKEAEKVTPNNKKMVIEKVEDKSGKGAKLSENGVKKDKIDKGKQKKKEKSNVVDKDAMREKESSDIGTDSEEGDFWAPPVGNRWDFDNGRDRWGSDTESGEDDDDGDDDDDDENIIEGEDEENESGELTKRTKRMSIEIGPSSFASRKKKSKTNSTSDPSSIA